MNKEQEREYQKSKNQQQKKIEYKNKYNKENYYRINLMFKKGSRKRIDEVCGIIGIKSVNEYIKELVYEDLYRIERGEESLYNTVKNQFINIF